MVACDHGFVYGGEYLGNVMVKTPDVFFCHLGVGLALIQAACVGQRLDFCQVVGVRTVSFVA